MQKFEYIQGKVYRRKTFTFFQKIILNLVWVFISVSIIAGILLQQNGKIPEGTAMLMVIVFAPLILGVSVMLYLALNPKGPEADFVLPTIEIDPNDCSVVKGVIVLNDQENIDVEVKVPNVYGASINILEDGTSNPQTGEISSAEMFEMALEEIQKKYPSANWKDQPELS